MDSKKEKKEQRCEEHRRTLYCVEYYSDVMGNGVRKFLTDGERDDWTIRVSLDQIYLYEEQENENKS